MRVKQPVEKSKNDENSNPVSPQNAIGKKRASEKKGSRVKWTLNEIRKTFRSAPRRRFDYPKFAFVLLSYLRFVAGVPSALFPR